MKTVIERIVEAQDYLNIAMSLMHLKDARERNGLWNDEEQETINRNIEMNLTEARDNINLAILIVEDW